MKFLFDLMDKKVAPLFKKGGKLERFYALYEAGDTFARTPADVTPSAPHVRDSIDQKRLMMFVIYALLPCLFFGIWNAGHEYNAYNNLDHTFGASIRQGATMVLPIVVVSYLVGGLWEVLFAIW